LIPIFSETDNRLLRYAPEEHILEHAHHFRLVRNRRGHLKVAYCRRSVSLDQRPVSSIGTAFEQHLSSGKIWALRGTPGAINGN
jgi:hypothetical protein